jgi:RNA methyltransferase, TrmH family
MPPFQLIESPTNATLKTWIGCHTAAGRAEHGLLLAEGPHAVQEAIAAGWQAHALAFWADSDEEAAALLDPLPLCPQAPQYYRLSQRAMNKVATTDTPPRTIGLFKPKHQSTLTECLANPGPLRLLILDGLQDPGNVGTLLRSAVAFELDGVVQVSPAVDCQSPKVIRASAGLAFRLPIWRWDEGLIELVETLVHHQTHVHLTAVSKGAQPVSTAQWHGRQALVLGNEGAGISMGPLEFPGLPRLKIPMSPMAESLNVGVSGAIVMSRWYESRMTQPSAG